MFWLLVGIIVVGLVGVVVAYRQWRRESPETAQRLEGTVRDLSYRAGQSAAAAGSAARSTARASADAMAQAAEASRESRMPLRWNGPDKPLHVGSFIIPHPMTYVANPRAGRVEEPSAIDPTAQVQATDADDLPPLPYWPSYSQLQPVQRYHYLRWLAAERRHMPPEIGYAFVFFYGLERRVLVDGQDIAMVVREVIRLRAMHAEDGERFSPSFAQYTGSFLFCLVAVVPEVFDLRLMQQLLTSVRYWNEDKLAVGLAWFAEQQQPLPDWAAYAVAGELPQSKRSVVARRVDDEFRQLFMKRYREQHGSGITLRTGKRQRQYVYRPASAVLEPITCTVGNALLVSQLRPLSKIWNACIDDLRKLSNVVKREGEEGLTVASWEAMPDDLRAGVDHPLTEPVCNLIDDHTDEDGHTMLPVSELARLLEVERRDRLTPTQSRRLCETVEHTGYGLVPDARLTGKSYRWEQNLAAYLRVTDEQVNPKQYQAASCMLRLGMAVAEADGNLDPGQIGVITNDIERWFHLNDEEQRRIETLRELLMREGVDLRGLKSVTKKLTVGQREAIGRMLLALAAENGVVTPEEMRAIRKCYRTLDIDASEIDTAFQTLKARQATTADEPVTVRAGKPTRRGEKIPSPEKGESAPQEQGLQLDRDAIRSIMAETHQVAELLAEATEDPGENRQPAMPTGSDQSSSGRQHEPLAADGGSSSPGATDTERAPRRTASAMDAGMQHHDDASGRDSPTTAFPPIEPSPASPDGKRPPRSLPGVPPRYAPVLAKLLERSEWEAEEIRAIVRGHGLMPGAVIEAINDWSFDQLGGQLLIEEGDTLYIETVLLDDWSRER